MEEYRVSMEWFLKYDNVELYYFQHMPEVITDLDNYADLSQHTQEINRFMAECFADGEYRLSADDYEQKLAEMKWFLETYDYDSLWEAE